MAGKCVWAIILILAGCACADAQCPAGSLAVIVNKSNPTDSLSMAQLRRILIGDVRAWPDHKSLAMVARDASSKVSQCALSNIVRMNDAEYRRYLMSAEFRGDDAMAIQTVDSDGSAARVIAGSAGAIAIVDLSSLPSISGSVKVVRVNGKNPGEAGYPL